MSDSVRYKEKSGVFMKFDYVNKHIIVRLDNHNLIVDTGSPESFSFNPALKSIKIYEHDFYLSRNSYNVNKEKVEKLVGTRVDGFLGMDILGRTNMVINFVDNDIRFEYVRGEILCFLENREFVCTKDLTINGKDGFMAVIDSGAKINYVSEEYVRTSDKQTDGFEDWSPTFGNLSGDLYDIRIGRLTMGSGSYTCDAQAGVIRKGLNPLKYISAGAILNPESLIPEDKTVISFDFTGKSVDLL